MKNVELKDFTIGTRNVRTLCMSRYLRIETILELERYLLNIIVIQELRWPGKGSLKSGNWTLFHKGVLDTNWILVSL